MSMRSASASTTKNGMDKRLATTFSKQMSAMGFSRNKNPCVIYNEEIERDFGRNDCIAHIVWVLVFDAGERRCCDTERSTAFCKGKYFKRKRTKKTKRKCEPRRF
jgi:hypothetical protein